MDSTATIVEMDSTGYEALSNALREAKAGKQPIENMQQDQETAQPQPVYNTKKYTIKKGDNSWDIDEDAEIEIMADKKPVTLTMRELKDRAAGEIAVKARMHTLAEEKKKVQGTLKEFASIAKKDPIGALEYISGKAKEADSEFAFDAYLKNLGEQAEKVAGMSESERSNWDLQKKLSKAEEDLSLQKVENAVAVKRQQILSDYPEIGDLELDHMVDAIVSHPELSAGIRNESDLVDTLEDLVEETVLQRDLITLIKEVAPSQSSDNEFIFYLSNQVRANPDLDEEDVRDIIREVFHTPQPQQSNTPKREAARRLSQRQFEHTPLDQMKTRNASDYDLLSMQLMEQREKNRLQKTRR